MTIIAVTQEIGSLGKEVSARLAERLGIQFVPHRAVEQTIARRMNVSQDTVLRLVQGDATLRERWQIDQRRLALYVAEEVFGLAARGDVLVRGWGAAFLLAPSLRVVRVRVCAPIASRVSLVKERLRISDERVARRKIESADAAQARLVQSHFGIDLKSAEHFDIVLNTERASVDDCVAQVMILAQSPKFQETAASRAEIGAMLLRARTRAMHSAEPAVGHGGMHVIVNSSTLSLVPTTDYEEAIARVELHLHGVSGGTVFGTWTRLPPDRNGVI